MDFGGGGERLGPRGCQRVRDFASRTRDGVLIRSNHNRWRMLPMLFLVLSMLALSASGGSVNDCHSVRYAYRERGLDLESQEVPRQPRQGKEGLRVHNYNV